MKADLYINGYIAEDDNFFGESNSFNSRKLNEFLSGLSKDVTELVVHINSGGGSVTDGFAIYDILKSQPFKVITQIEGMCGSIATVIAMAGSERRMFQNSEYFIHNPMWSPNGPDYHTADDLEGLTAELRKAEIKIVDFYLKHTNAKREDLEAKMKAETTLTAQEAFDLGFITEIINTDVKAMVKYKIAACALPLTKKQDTMSKLTQEFEAKFKSLEAMIAKLTKGKIVNGMIQTADGSTTVYFDGAAFVVGSPVFSDEAMTTPLEDGEYMLESGVTITVANGMVETVTEAQNPDMAAVKAENDALKAEKEELQAKLTKAESDLQANIQATKKVSDEFVAFKKQILTGGKEIFEKEGQDPKSTDQPAKPADWRQTVLEARKQKKEGK